MFTSVSLAWPYQDCLGNNNVNDIRRTKDKKILFVEQCTLLKMFFTLCTWVICVKLGKNQSSEQKILSHHLFIWSKLDSGTVSAVIDWWLRQHHSCIEFFKSIVSGLDDPDFCWLCLHHTTGNDLCGIKTVRKQKPWPSLEKCQTAFILISWNACNGSPHKSMSKPSLLLLEHSCADLGLPRTSFPESDSWHSVNPLYMQQFGDADQKKFFSCSKSAAWS